jgi:uncharacterized protein YdaU (DUF1376 family)
MAKDPAFLFYSSDFISGTIDLTFEEKGQYITLLCIQHQKGRLSSKAVAIAVPNATADVLSKFSVDENGLYYNERLEIEAKKRAKHSDKQRQRAINGWKKRKATADATALPLEDEDRNDNKDSSYSLKESVREKVNFSDLENTQWFESILRYLQLKINLEELIKYWNQFQEGMIADDDLYREKEDYRSHFRNWVKIQIENNEKNRTNNKGFECDTTRAAIEQVNNGFK